MSKRNQRRVRNFLIEPKRQFEFALFSVVWGLTLATAMMCLFYMFVVDQEDGSISQALSDHPKVWLFATIVSISLASILQNIALTHRVFGSAAALRRHVKAVRAGDLAYRTKLRPRDAFHDLATDLNELSEELGAGHSHLNPAARPAG